MHASLPLAEQKTIHLSYDSVVNEDIIKALEDMMAFASPQQYCDTLIEIYHQYIIHEHQTLPPDFGEMAKRMRLMVAFLKSCEK